MIYAMNPASFASRYANTGHDVGDIGRPSKRIRTASCCAMDHVETLSLSGNNAFQQGKFLEAEDHFTRALRRIGASNVVSKQSTAKNTAQDFTGDSYALSSISKYDEGMLQFQNPEAVRDMFEADSISSRLNYNIGLCKTAKADFATALACFEVSLQQAQRSSEAEKKLQFRVLQQIGYCHFIMGNGKEANQRYQQALELAAELDHIAVGACLNCMAVVYFHHRPELADEAMELLKQSLAIYRETLGDVSKEVATVLNNIGRIHYLRSEYKDALAVYSESLTIRVQVLGEASVDVAATVYNSGQCYHQLGQLDNAMQYYERFLGTIKVNGRLSSRDAAIVYRGIGDIHQEKNETKHAINAFKNALQAEKESLGKFHHEVASTLNKLGNLCYETQDFVSALIYYKEGLKIETTILEPLHPHIVITLTNIAHIEKQRRNYAAALHAYLQVYQKQQMCCTDRIPLAVTLSSIGLVQYHLRQYEEAFDSYQEALRLRREHFGTDDAPDIASTLNSIGLVLFKQEMFDLARNCFSESLRIRTKLLGKDHKDVAILWYNIATIYFETGIDDLAIKMYKETLRVERAALGPSHPDVVLTLQHIGQVLQQVGNLGDALNFFQEALDIEKKMNRDDVSIAKILNLIGNIHLQEGNVEPMMVTFTEASRLLERNGRRGEALLIAGHNFYGLSKLHPKCAPIA